MNLSALAKFFAARARVGCAAAGDHTYCKLFFSEIIGIAILSSQKRSALDSFIKKDFRAAETFPIIVGDNQNAMRGRRK
jgi:hypothetical protein